MSTTGAPLLPEGVITRVLVTLIILLVDVDTAAAEQPQIEAAGNSSFAIDSGSRLFGWGDDSYGQLGLGRLLQSSTPLRVGTGFSMTPVRHNVKTIAAGTKHVVALKADGTLWTWGGNDLG